MAAELCRKGTRFVDIPDFVVRLRGRDTLGVYDMIDVFFLFASTENLSEVSKSKLGF